VAEIVSEIASASAEQAAGVDRVKSALSQMDEVTQQNSALVEENAAATKALEQQSHAMDERVSFFRLSDEQRDAAVAEPQVTPIKRAAAQRAEPVRPVPQKRAAATPKPSPVPPRRRNGGRMQSALAPALSNDADWKEF